MARKRRPENWELWRPGDAVLSMNELKITCPHCEDQRLTKASDYRHGNRPVDSRMGARRRGEPLYDSEEEDESYQDEADYEEGHQGGHQPRGHQDDYRDETDFVDRQTFDEFAKTVLGLLREADPDADPDEDDGNEEKVLDRKGLPGWMAKEDVEWFQQAFARLDRIEAQVLRKGLSLEKSATTRPPGDPAVVEAQTRWARSRGTAPW